VREPCLSADIIVAGAGPAGATVARILALRGLKVIMIDALARPVDRLELIAPAARPMLQALDLEKLLDDPVIARPCLGIRRRWGAAGDQVEDFLRHPWSLGHVVDRRRFDAALRARAVAAGAIALRARVAGVSRQGAQMVAEVGRGTESRSLAGTEIVDATGRAAAVARRLGAAHLCFETRVGTRCEARHEASAGGVWLEVEGDAAGWSYKLCGPAGRTERWHFPRGGAALGDRRADASSARLDRAAGEHWVAVGDAAAAFDPVTSQGLANALSTAQVASGMILGSDGTGAGAEFYAEAVAATHRRSELARMEVYRALEASAAA
jgi:flavin-dependent dehydrogenase